MAGLGGYKICLQSELIANLVTLDIDPTDAQYLKVPPSGHKQDGLPIYQGFDGVTWIFECVTDALVDQFTARIGQLVFIKTRLRDKYNFGNKKAIFDDFQTRSRVRGRCLEGRATFVNVEAV